MFWQAAMSQSWICWRQSRRQRARLKPWQLAACAKPALHQMPAPTIIAPRLVAFGLGAGLHDQFMIAVTLHDAAML